MYKFVHSVLGADYEVEFGSREEVNLLDDNIGECRLFGKKILVCSEYDDGEYTEEELRVKVQEVVAHEILHAYLNEAGIMLKEDEEERLADFFMKNWRKMNNSILTILDRTNFLD